MHTYLLQILEVNEHILVTSQAGSHKLSSFMVIHTCTASCSAFRNQICGVVRCVLHASLCTHATLTASLQPCNFHHHSFAP